MLKFMDLLKINMERPSSYGWFHFMCIGISITLIVILLFLRKKYSEKQLKIVIGLYSIITLILEALKQISWSFNYSEGMITWDYQWYAAPFQLCTTPLYVCLICLFLKKGKLRDYLFDYLVFFTILGSISTMIYPESCFTSEILINVHTMVLHCGSFVVSCYLVMNKLVKIKIKELFNGYKVFLIFALIALVIDIGIYKSGILNGETFNMFYISPYFISSLPVFNILQEKLPYLVFLFLYFLFIFIGGIIIMLIFKLYNKLDRKKDN